MPAQIPTIQAEDNLAYLEQKVTPLPADLQEARRVVQFLLTDKVCVFYLDHLETLATMFDTMGRRGRSATTEPPERRDRNFGTADGLRQYRKLLERDLKRLTEELNERTKSE